MANWFYFDSTGNKLGPVDSATLKLLAQHGAITPETPIETESGKQAKASDIKGLAFAPAASPSSVPVPPVAAPTTPPMTSVMPVSVSTGPAFRSGPIVVLDGNGCQLEVYDGKVVIIRKPGCSVFFLHGLKGDKTLYFSKMTGLQFKKNMYLQFTVPRGIESTGGLGSAVTDENTVLFGPKQNDLAKAIHDFIEDRIMGNSTPPEHFFVGFSTPTASVAASPKKKFFTRSGCLIIVAVLLVPGIIRAIIDPPPASNSQPIQRPASTQSNEGQKKLVVDKVVSTATTKLGFPDPPLIEFERTTHLGNNKWETEMTLSERKPNPAGTRIICTVNATVDFSGGEGKITSWKVENH